MCTQRGLSGARTCSSIPSPGRCVANLSGRCTPPPPAGGKYRGTRRTFTATDRRDCTATLAAHGAPIARTAARSILGLELGLILLWVVLGSILSLITAQVAD